MKQSGTDKKLPHQCIIKSRRAMERFKPTTVSEYIAAFPNDVQKILKQIRRTVKKVAPGAAEKISYGIPALTLDGKYIIYYAAHKHHIGLYPEPGKDKGFAKDYAPYKTSGKGTIQFPFNQPMPLALIEKIVKFRIREAGRK